MKFWTKVELQEQFPVVKSGYTYKSYAEVRHVNWSTENTDLSISSIMITEALRMLETTQG